MGTLAKGRLVHSAPRVKEWRKRVAWRWRRMARRSNLDGMARRINLDGVPVTKAILSRPLGRVLLLVACALRSPHYPSNLGAEKPPRSPSHLLPDKESSYAPHISFPMWTHHASLPPAHLPNLTHRSSQHSSYLYIDEDTSMIPWTRPSQPPPTSFLLLPLRSSNYLCGHITYPTLNTYPTLISTCFLKDTSHISPTLLFSDSLLSAGAARRRGHQDAHDRPLHKAHDGYRCQAAPEPGGGRGVGRSCSGEWTWWHAG